MKFLVIAVALLACASADVSELSGYNYPQPAPVAVPQTIPQQPESSYIPPSAPAPEVAPIPQLPALILPQPDRSYVPPPAPAPFVPAPASVPFVPAPVSAPANSYIPPAAPQPQPIEEIEQPAQDGYHYKVVRRRVFRHRY